MNCWVVSFYYKDLHRWFHYGFIERRYALSKAFHLARNYYVKVQRIRLNMTMLLSLYSIDGRRL